MSGTTPIGGATSTQSTTALNPNGQLGKDDFLKLLVAQLKNQDPANPMDSSQFMGQLAQFSSLEQMTNVAEGVQSLGTTTAVSQAVSLIGHQVVYGNADGTTATGVADGVTVSGGVVQIDVAGQTITLDSVLGVGPLAASSGTGSTGTPTTTP